MTTYTPRYTSIVTLLSKTVARFPNRPVFGTRKNHGWHYISYAEFDALVAAMRGGLKQLGVAIGDRVAAISDNRVEWAVGSFGTLSLGAAYVPMYQAQKDAEYKYILRDSGAKVCLCANTQIAERIRKLLPELPELKHIIAFDSADYEKLLESGRKTPSAAPEVDPSRLAFLIYTSGTTGDPKGVELTHLNLGATASGIIEVAPLTEDNELTVAFLPWAHVFGGCVEVAVIMGFGGAMAICEKADRLLDYLAEVKPTALFAVPRIWNRVYENVNKQIDARPAPLQKLLRTGLAARAKHNKGQSLSALEKAAMLVTTKLLVGKIKARLGGRVRFAVSGAAALAPEVAEFIDTLGIVVLEGYGLTETTAGGTASKPKERKIGSVGKPMPGARIVIDATVSGTEAAEGEGEIIVYGPNVMRGYHNLPEQSRAAFTPDGGLRTGDLGRIDQDGYLFITGRVKELYKLNNGKYIAPAALEEKLQLSPYIAQCFVYGSDRPHNTAVIVAEMTNVEEYCKRHGISTSEPPERLLQLPQIRELFRHEIDRYSRDFKGFEQIRSFVLTPEPFTTDNDLMTQTLKIKRRNVVSKYQRDLVALYA
jgi:long-chain acyl-CoA synthetase